MFSRKIVGPSIDSSQRSSLVVNACPRQRRNEIGEGAAAFFCWSDCSLPVSRSRYAHPTAVGG
ncbi:hypothetical protein [Nocardia sp. NBC_01009]|uniref:hypothetical protein n=1 Tax=Nocardia sp. NBC_01009 TaxID=2975996 RepID=UPI0038637B06|nr:hypothetical protein OHA42_29500 [Nocardia sp. NBC_01009]